jgi:hypothetical protein
MLFSIQIDRGKHPEVDLYRVLRNIHMNGLTNTVTSKCYAAIHDVRPTHDRLAAINLVPTTACPNSQNQNPVLNRITECRDG